MFITAGFYSSLTGPQTYGALAGAVDQSLTLGQGNGYILPQRMRVTKALAVGTVVTAAQIQAPSLRNLAYPEIYPVIVAAVVPDNYPLLDMGGRGPIIQANEQLQVGVGNSGAGATDNWAALWLQDKPNPAPGGQMFTAVATTTVTLIKGAWVLGTLSFGTALVPGVYSVVGMETVGTGALISRLVFPGVSQYRPGVLAQAAYGRTDRYGQFRSGNSGLFGTFLNTAQPNIEFFGLAAGAQSFTVFLDLIKQG